MSAYYPDLDAKLIPGVSAAGFRLGESISEVVRRVGGVSWYVSDSSANELLAKNNCWIGLRLECGSAIGLDEMVLSYVYLNELVSLYFEKSEILYRISVGKGYRGSCYGLIPGCKFVSTDLSSDFLFNSMDDDFLFLKDGDVVEGVSFVTDYRASLEDAPDQTLKFISIHDWSLR